MGYQFKFEVVALVDGVMWVSRTDDSGADCTDMAVCAVVDDDNDIWGALVDAIRLIEYWVN